MRIGCDAVKMGPGESQRSHKKDEFVTTEEIINGINTHINYIHHISSLKCETGNHLKGPDRFEMTKT